MIVDSECNSQIIDLIKKLTKVNSHNKIYLNGQDAIYLNNTKYMVIKSCNLDVNRDFFGDNFELIKRIISIKKELNIEDLYFEFFKNGSHVIKCPKKNEAFILKYLHEIENDCFINSFIDRCKNKDEFFLKSMERMLSLHDIKKSLYILQYLFAYDAVEPTVAKNLLNIFIQALFNCNHKCIEKNNFRYISSAVINVFSLEFFEI